MECSLTKWDELENLQVHEAQAVHNLLAWLRELDVQHEVEPAGELEKCNENLVDTQRCVVKVR